tara:strand:- start:973 stop:1263 length:291 start_codon:yes stop_codon:yes gene_type:complete
MIQNNLKRILEKNNITVAQLSRDTGVPRTNLHQWLTGSAPNIEQAYKVANYFNMSLEELCIEKCTDGLKCIGDEIRIESGTYRIQLVKVNEPEEVN